ncbi:methylenetetrahydrofolate reductase 1 [Entomophthora muscae]|nr:methylenetetrahydrofolate reductase 1 [Entomophthora muscae]
MGASIHSPYSTEFSSMKITDILKLHNATLPLFSFEFSPPSTPQGEALLQPRISNLAKTSPAFASVTWGAGGTSTNKSLAMAVALQGKGLEVLMHITTSNTTSAEIVSKLIVAKDAGIKNLLVLRGDRVDPNSYSSRGVKESVDSVASPHAFDHANELVSFIREKFSDSFCIGVAAYPEMHPESKNEEEDLKYLKQKVDSGADFILTQFFFNASIYHPWVRKVRALGINHPIIPNVMVFRNATSLEKLIGLAKVNLPYALRRQLDANLGKKEIEALGIKTSTEIMENLISSRENYNDLPCVHLSTLNQEDSVKQVLQNVGWSWPQNQGSKNKRCLQSLK